MNHTYAYTYSNGTAFESTGSPTVMSVYFEKFGECPKVIGAWKIKKLKTKSR